MEKQKHNPLRRLLQDIEAQNEMDNLLKYTPNKIKTDYLISLDLEKLKKEFGSGHINLIDFIEIIFNQLFNSSIDIYSSVSVVY